MGRVAALLGASALLGAYYGTVSHLPGASVWWEVAWLGLVLIPVVFAVVLVLLPLSRLPAARLGVLALVFLVLAIILGLAGLHLLANFAKLGAMTFAAWGFLWFFEELSWVVIVALLIPWVDAYSVWRGPTNTIVNEHASVFSAFSFTFPLPDGVTKLGLPDLFFYALFLGSALRWELRVRLTWLTLTLSFGATLALTIWWDVGGLPALPMLALAFLAPNVDLFWRRFRGARPQTAPG